MGRKLPRAFGPYLFTRLLGQGGYGRVYLAHPMERDSHLPSTLVVKTLKREHAGDESFVGRFQHEAAVAVRIDSPYIAQVHDAGAVGDELYIAMEYVRGSPLNRLLKELKRKEQQLAPSKVVSLCSGGLLALADVHRAVDPKSGTPLSIIHRDVSPKNLIVAPDETMKLIDLGIGKSELQGWQTQTGCVVGSPGYMAPEQVSGSKIDQRIDLYAMAVVIYEVLTLQSYVPRGQLMQVLKASLNPKFTPPSQIRRDVGEELDRVLKKALAIEAGGRYQTALELLDALRGAVEPDDEKTRISIQVEPVPEERPALMQVEQDLRRTTIFARRASTTLPGLTTKPMPSVLSRRRKTPVVWLSGAVIGAIAIGISLARLMDGGAAPIVVEEPAQPLEQPAEASAVPHARQGDESPQPLREIERPVRIKRNVPPRPVAPPRPSPRPAAPALDLDSLETRARALSRSAEVDRTEVHRLLADIAMEQASRDAPDSKDRLHGLKERVEALESQARR